MSRLGGGVLDVIVVDDGSTDATGAIADEYAEKHPEIFRVVHKENGHYGSTVNVSLPIARGKYYRLLDSDDWLDYEGLRQWLPVLAETDADAAVTTSVRVMESSGDEITMEPCPGVLEGEYSIDAFPCGEVPGPGISNLAWRTDFLQNMGLKLLEHCNYVDEELRCIPWCHVKTVRVDHIPVYIVLKERAGQSTSIEGLRRSAPDKERMLWHIQEVADLGQRGSRNKSQEMAMDVAISVAVGHYGNMLLLKPNYETKRLLMEFDERLRQDWPEVYERSGRSRSVKALRISRFALYAPMARRRVRKWRY